MATDRRATSGMTKNMALAHTTANTITKCSKSKLVNRKKICGLVKAHSGWKMAQGRTAIGLKMYHMGRVE